MKARFNLSVLLVVALACCGGCQKREEKIEIPAPEFSGVKVNLPKLEAEFATAGAEVLQTLSHIRHNFNYGLYLKAVADLERLAKLPNLTDVQRQVVAEVVSQAQPLLTKAAGK